MVWKAETEQEEEWGGDRFAIKFYRDKVMKKDIGENESRRRCGPQPCHEEVEEKEMSKASSNHSPHSILPTQCETGCMLNTLAWIYLCSSRKSPRLSSNMPKALRMSLRYSQGTSRLPQESAPWIKMGSLITSC